MAGHGHNLRATGVHDLLYARAVVLADDTRKIALVAVDSIGVQYPSVERVRNQLSGIDYCLVASTHTHEGPDAIGLWGPSPAESGVVPEYLAQLEKGIVAAVRQAESTLAPARAEYATADDQTLLADYRLPDVFDTRLRAVRFVNPKNGQTMGLIVQWNSHPVEPKDNTLLSRDFMGVTVATLEAQHRAPVVYFSGAVGGLMGTPNKLFRDAAGKSRAKDVFDYIRLYGEAVADLTDRALQQAQPLRFSPLAVSARSVAVPMTNPGYRAARKVGVLGRPAFQWTGDWQRHGTEIPREQLEGDQAIASEVACLRLGELYLAAIPGELYPELVYGEFPAKLSLASIIRPRRSNRRSCSYCRVERRRNHSSLGWPTTNSATSFPNANGTPQLPMPTIGNRRNMGSEIASAPTPPEYCLKQWGPASARFPDDRARDLRINPLLSTRRLRRGECHAAQAERPPAAGRLPSGGR